MGVQRLKKSEEVRESLTRNSLKKIQSLYNDVYKDVSRELRKKKSKYPARELTALKRNIEQNMQAVNEDIKNDTLKDMQTVCVQVVEDKKKVLKEYGFNSTDIQTAWIHVPDYVARSIANGDVYNEGWTLSKAIWGHSKQVQDHLNQIISKGVASGKDTMDIARDLETFVKPEASKRSRVIEFQKYKRDSQGLILKDENGKSIPDGKPRKFYFGNIDYNAQRLARTMIAHAYQQSFERVNEHDPFVTGYIWRASGQHGRTCEICLDRDGRLFKKDELPLDHPNGMCTFEAYFPDSIENIADRIKKWYESEPGTYPEIDRYAEDFM